MSFLEQLKSKRKTLKECNTIITTTTGEKFLGNISSVENLQKLEGQTTYGFVVDNKPDFVPACILDKFLYLGSQDAVTIDNIDEFSLTHILSIGIECPLAVEYLPANVKNLYVPCLDLPESSLKDSVFDKSFDFIEQAHSREGGCVLVHCNAGVSRSASVVIAYLINFCNMSFDEAYGHVKAKRNCIQPNAGFLMQLKEFKN